MASGLRPICFEAQKMRLVGITGAAVGEFRVPVSLPAYSSFSANCSLVRHLWGEKKQTKAAGKSGIWP